MSEKYEAAEMIVLGKAQDIILGLKDWPDMDNRIDPDMLRQDTALAVYEE